MGSFILRTTAVLRSLVQGPGLLLAHVGADGHPCPDAHPLADHPPLLRGKGRGRPDRRVLRSVAFVLFAGIFHVVQSQRRLVGPLASRYGSRDRPPGADGMGACAERRLRTREMYVPLSHPPGDAQCDFGQAKAVIGGVEQTIHYFVLDLPHSDACFVKAYPAETTEAFCDGHVSAFSFLGGVPRSIVSTTRDWRWPGSWETAGASALVCSLNSSPTTCSMTDSAVQARVTTRARWRGWWDMLLSMWRLACLDEVLFRKAA